MKSTIKEIKVWDRGQITIPKNLRKELDIQDKTIIYAEKLGTGIFLRPKTSVISEIQKKGEALMRKKGLKIEDLINEEG